MGIQIAPLCTAIGGPGSRCVTGGGRGRRDHCASVLAVESIHPGEECSHRTSAWQSLKSSEQSRCLVRKQRQKLRQMDWIVVGLGEEVFM